MLTCSGACNQGDNCGRSSCAIDIVMPDPEDDELLDYLWPI